METVIVLGRSLFLQKSERLLPELIKKYPTIAINATITAYPQASHWFTFDQQDFKSHINKPYKIVANAVKCKLKGSNIETYLPVGDMIDINKGSEIVGFAGFTVTSCLNWLYKKGTTSVYLIGHDLPYCVWKYSYGKRTIHPTRRKIDRARNFIYKMNRFLNIYQTNPDSDMDLPYMDINLL
jgi:hypothetical protein